jgi:hypothetical protein
MQTKDVVSVILFLISETVGKNEFSGVHSISCFSALCKKQ